MQPEKNNKTRLVIAGSLMDDPEFMKTNDLDRIDQHTLELPADRSRKQLKEVIRREIRQSIKRRLLYT